MFDFLRNLTKSAGERRREAVTAYLDNALSPRERQRFERELAQDLALQAQLEAERRLQEQLRALPRRRVPRNFTLDPALYGRPQRQPLLQLYPALRVATALNAVFFIVILVLSVFSSSVPMALPASVAYDSPSSNEAMEAPAEAEESVAGEAVLTTRIVMETEEIEAEAAAEEPMAVATAGPVAQATEAAVTSAESPPQAFATQPLFTATAVPTAAVTEEEANTIVPSASGFPTFTPTATETAVAAADTAEGSPPVISATAEPMETAVGLYEALTTVPAPLEQSATPLPTATTSVLPHLQPTPTIEGLRYSYQISPTAQTDSAVANVTEPQSTKTAVSGTSSFDPLSNLLLILTATFVILFVATLLVRRRLQ